MNIKFKLSQDTPPVPHQQGIRASRGRFFKNAKLVTYEMAVAEQAEKIKEETSGIGYLMDKPIKVCVEFSYPHNRFADIDNVYKSTIDGMEGILFDNDKQIYETTIRRSFNDKGKYIIGIMLKYMVDKDRYGYKNPTKFINF